MPNRRWPVANELSRVLWGSLSHNALSEIFSFLNFILLFLFYIFSLFDLCVCITAANLVFWASWVFKQVVLYFLVPSLMFMSFCLFYTIPMCSFLFFLIILYFTLLYLIHTYLLSNGRQKWDRFRREGKQEGAGSIRGKHYQDIVCEKIYFQWKKNIF